MKKFQTSSSVLAATLLLLLIGTLSFQLFLMEGSSSYIHAEETTTTSANAPGTGTSTITDELEQILNSQASAREEHQFQAEINQLLGIIINSLYSNKDIFLRELISNASDALNKIRFLSLTDRKALESNPNLEIRIWADPNANILKIRDTGIGMTKQDLMQNLGTIAKSGTKAFIEKLQKEAAATSPDNSLIGQFGVGFYSVFLVASKVAVTTKHNDDKQYIWTSTADNTFTIVEDPRGDTLGRGTELTIYLKDDAKDYANVSKLKDLIKKYSSFIHFPIYLHEVRTEVEEVPVEEETASAQTTTESETKPEDETKPEEVKVEEESKTPEKKTKKVEKTVEEWKIMNEQKPLWLRSPSNITDEEYIQFYKAMTGLTEDPLFWELFSAEGQVEFKSLLYFPSKAPFNMFDFTQKANNIKLYVKRVFITDQAVEELLPRYLNFIRGLVDSEDLPLNVSRETLQHSKLLAMIRKKLLAKAIQIMNELSEKDKTERKERKEKKQQEEEQKKEDKKEDKNLTKYEKFWKEFGKNIKLGVIEDDRNRNKLVSMLRFTTSKSTDEAISLEEYVERKKEKQEQIYFVTGQDMKDVESSPLLEEFKKRDLEVIYMIDPLDEYMVQQLHEFKSMKLQNIAKEDVKFPDEDEEQKKKETEELTKEYDSLISVMNLLLKDKVSKVTISRRTSNAPAVLVASSFGVSANMARIMKAQALGQEQSHMDWMMKLRTIEINANHPMIQNMNNLLKNNVNDNTLTEAITLLYDTASLISGYDLEDKKAFTDRLVNVVTSGLSYKNAQAEQKTSPPEVKATELLLLVQRRRTTFPTFSPLLQLLLHGAKHLLIPSSPTPFKAIPPITLHGSLNSPSLSALKLSLDPNSLLFAVATSNDSTTTTTTTKTATTTTNQEGQLLMIVDHHQHENNTTRSDASYLASLAAETGLWKILLKLPVTTDRPMSAMNNVLTALYDSKKNNYFVLRMCQSDSVCLVKISLQNLDVAIADRYFFKSSVLCSNYSSSTNSGGVYFISYSIGAARVGQIPKLGEPYVHYQVKKDLIFTQEKKLNQSLKNGILHNLRENEILHTTTRREFSSTPSRMVYFGPLVSVSNDHSVIALSNQHSYEYVDYMNKVIEKKIPKQYSATSLPQFGFYSLGNGKFYACTEDLDCQSF
nr:unnamed protein product [Naegleria fowleri]